MSVIACSLSGPASRISLLDCRRSCTLPPQASSQTSHQYSSSPARFRLLPRTNTSCTSLRRTSLPPSQNTRNVDLRWGCVTSRRRNPIVVLILVRYPAPSLPRSNRKQSNTNPNERPSGPRRRYDPTVSPPLGVQAVTVTVTPVLAQVTSRHRAPTICFPRQLSISSQIPV
jgi:hypothetical protein